MKKAILILKNLSPRVKNYKGKVKLLAEIIATPTTGHICPGNLVNWCKKVGLKTELHCEDRTSWWTVSGVEEHTEGRLPFKPVLGEAFVKGVLAQYTKEEISFGKMVELFNQKISLNS